ncbi:hypothetical protein L211DRAFT_844619 [Terfezia boudieri ATCC MYA-4762]|uniref:Endonuclease/exonuclease/phosphatase domain-containing protein n=1 Tax=Terfezia boudieri ATCC MYA-4762 TaxID=1051890 RepID=A0A3N4M3U6_9PEZI|nr:hypothetical protein L211DRAFT_844619 [Terfezia boudieri ATCC MYA-4762]
MAFWRNRWDGKVKVVSEEDTLVFLELEGKRVGGVYADGKLHGTAWKDWLGKVELLTGREGGVVGDWNAHSEAWDSGNKEDSRGRTMADWVVGSGFEIADGGPWIWERVRRGRLERSKIDLFLSRGAKRWEKAESAKLGSDHWAIVVEIDWGESQRNAVKEVVDWRMLEDMVEEVVEEKKEDA